jgi:hypothetical protein
MIEPEDAECVADDDSEPTPTQQERAIAAINAIAAGADPSREAFRLANDFTDRQTAKLSDWVGRLKRRR